MVDVVIGKNPVVNIEQAVRQSDFFEVVALAECSIIKFLAAFRYGVAGGGCGWRICHQAIIFCAEQNAVFCIISFAVICNCKFFQVVAVVKGTFSDFCNGCRNGDFLQSVAIIKSIGGNTSNDRAVQFFWNGDFLVFSGVTRDIAL